MGTLNAEIGRYDRMQGVKQSACLLSVILLLSARNPRKPPDLGIRATPKHNEFVENLLHFALNRPTSVVITAL